MNTGLDIGRVLDIWLEDGPHTIAERVVDDALRTVGRTEQQRGWRSIVRVPARPMPIRLAAYMALVLALALGAAVIAGVLGGRVFVPGPVTTASPPPSSPVASADCPAIGNARPARLEAAATCGRDAAPDGQPDDRRPDLHDPLVRTGLHHRWRGWLAGPAAGTGRGPARGPRHAYFFGGQPSGNPLLMPTLSIIRPAQVVTGGRCDGAGPGGPARLAAGPHRPVARRTEPGADR